MQPLAYSLHLAAVFPPLEANGPAQATMLHQSAIHPTTGQSLPGKIEEFCFPDANTSLRFARSMSKKHVFALTGSGGERQYGHCHRWVGPPLMSTPENTNSVTDDSHQGTVSLYALCILSSQSEEWNDVFERILVLLESIIFPPPPTRPSRLIDRFKWALHLVQKVCEAFAAEYQKRHGSDRLMSSLPEHSGLSQIFMNRGNYTRTSQWDSAGLAVDSETLQIHIAAPDLSGGNVQDLHLITPPVSPHQGLTYHTAHLTCLMNALDTSNRYIMIFAALLFERRIVFVSKDLQKLTDCIYAVMSFIQPFTWQYIFIPVLPPSLLNYCTAPMPFIVGIHSSHLKTVQAMPVDEILYVHLDTGSLKTTATLYEDVQAIPPRWRDQLSEELDNTLTTYQQAHFAPDSESLAQAFRHFFCVMLYGYYNHFQVQSNGTISFNMEDFLMAQTREMRPLCQQFCSSQLFHTYADKVALRMETGDKQHQFEYDLFQFVQANPRGLVEQLSQGFTSVLSKYKTKKDLYNRAKHYSSELTRRAMAPPPSASSGVSYSSGSHTTSSVAKPARPTPEVARKPVRKVPTLEEYAAMPAPPRHPRNELWDTAPETVRFTALHNLFSPRCDRQKYGVLVHTRQEPPLIDFSFDDTAAAPPPAAINNQRLSVNLLSFLDSPNPSDEAKPPTDSNTNALGFDFPSVPSQMPSQTKGFEFGEFQSSGSLSSSWGQDAASPSVSVHAAPSLLDSPFSSMESQNNTSSQLPVPAQLNSLGSSGSWNPPPQAATNLASPYATNPPPLTPPASPLNNSQSSVSSFGFDFPSVPSQNHGPSQLLPQLPPRTHGSQSNHPPSSNPPPRHESLFDLLK